MQVLLTIWVFLVLWELFFLTAIALQYRTLTKFKEDYVTYDIETRRAFECVILTPLGCLFFTSCIIIFYFIYTIIGSILS